jgi:hypothetical protein
MCGREHHVGMDDWMEYVNCMNDVVDRETKKFGPKPTPKQVSYLARYRGFHYQRNETKNQDKPQTSVPKVPSPPPKSIVSTNTELNIDLGGG